MSRFSNSKVSSRISKTASISSSTSTSTLTPTSTGSIPSRRRTSFHEESKQVHHSLTKLSPWKAPRHQRSTLSQFQSKRITSSQDLIKYNLALILAGFFRFIPWISVLLLLLLSLSPRARSLFPWPISSILLLYTLADTIFLLYQWHFTRTHQRLLRPPAVTRASRSRLLDHCFENMMDPMYMISGWFLGAPPSSIRRGNVEEWLAWALFFVDPIHLTVREEQELSMYIDRFETYVGKALPPGKNQDIHCIRLSLQPFRVIPRPLVYYLSISLAGSICGLMLRSMGFTLIRFPNWSIWIRFPSSTHSRASRKQGQPIVLAHGLSAGLGPYMNVMMHLVRRKGDTHPILALHLPNLCAGFPWMGPGDKGSVPSMDNMIPDLLRTFHKHQLPPATWIGHSFGTIITTWAIKGGKGQLVGKSIFVDPVCFALWEPELVYNFVYKPPTSAMDVLIRYFVGRECGVAKSIGRHFWWHQNILLAPDIPQGSTIFLSENDGIIDASKVAWYLARFPQPSVHVFPGTKHAEWLIRPKLRDRILDAIPPS